MVDGCSRASCAGCLGGCPSCRGLAAVGLRCESEALKPRLVAGGCCGFGGGGGDFSDEVGEHAPEAPAGGAAGQAAVVFEGFVSGRNRELLIEYASAGEAERFTQLGLGPDGAEHAGA